MGVRKNAKSAQNTTQIPNHETTNKLCDISKQHSKQAKTGKMAYPVFVNPGRNKPRDISMTEFTEIHSIFLFIFFFCRLSSFDCGAIHSDCLHSR